MNELLDPAESHDNEVVNGIDESVETAPKKLGEKEVISGKSAE